MNTTSPSPAHSPLPWYVHTSGDTGAIFIAACGRDDNVAAVPHSRHHDAAANARRIAAAVNACDGLTTDALEKGVVKDAFRALDYLLEQTVDMDLSFGIVLTEGEAEARRKALAVFETANSSAA